ncbi:MAG TPA: hypothetical protein VMU54_22190 [Planctomycetota bacterium]|nr:hypothetical protein [Planctomycetota bacterium]
MKTNLLIFFSGVLVAAVLVIATLLQKQPEPPAAPQEPAPPPPAHAPWVEFFEEIQGDPGVVSQPLVWLATQHHDDGTWGDGPAALGGERIGKTGLTSLALLPFFGAGYTPLSKDRYEFEGGEWCVGVEIRKALDWLRRDQREDGTFQSPGGGAFDQVLAAFAFSEAYGLTLHEVWKKSAQLAVDALAKMQKPDGTWEGDDLTPWAIIALYSARLSEIQVDPARIHDALHAAGPPGHPGDVLARVLSKRDEARAVWRLEQETADRDSADVTWWYLAAAAMWAYQGTAGAHWWEYQPGPRWGPWSRVLREKILPLLSKEGSVAGKSPSDRIARTSVVQLTLEASYGYTCAFMPH